MAYFVVYGDSDMLVGMKEFTDTERLNEFINRAYDVYEEFKIIKGVECDVVTQTTYAVEGNE